jgi:hypothetical protein
MFDYIPTPVADADFTDTDDDGKIVHDIIPNNIPSDLQTHKNIPLPPLPTLQ